MRQRDAVAHARRPQRFAFLQPVDRHGRRQPVGLACDFAQFLEQPLLRGELADDADGSRDK